MQYFFKNFFITFLSIKLRIIYSLFVHSFYSLLNVFDNQKASEALVKVGTLSHRDLSDKMVVARVLGYTTEGSLDDVEIFRVIIMLSKGRNWADNNEKRIKIWTQNRLVQ